MAITGKIERDGTVTVTWNIQAEKLVAPGWEGAHYLPCEVCGLLQVVGGRIVACTCAACADFRKREFRLDGTLVEDPAEFIQHLEPYDRRVMVAMELGGEMNLGGGAAPLFVLRRVL
jgi:hypothetical protein